MKGEQQISYVRCDACTELHPSTECEVVVIRLTKGKQCDINKARMFSPAPPSRIIPPAFVDNAGTPPPEPKPQPPKKSIVPPGVASMMIPQGHPEFEAKGAKEFRQA